MSDNENEEVEAQPNGVDLSPTAMSINEILTNPEFAQQIREHNGWSEDATDDHTAILFLAVRYQESMEILHRRTKELQRLIQGLDNRISEDTCVSV